MDECFGEISRAMRNRCVELHMCGEEAEGVFDDSSDDINDNSNNINNSNNSKNNNKIEKLKKVEKMKNNSIISNISKNNDDGNKDMYVHSGFSSDIFVNILETLMNEHIYYNTDTYIHT